MDIENLEKIKKVSQEVKDFLRSNKFETNEEQKICLVLFTLARLDQITDQLITTDKVLNKILVEIGRNTNAVKAIDLEN